MKVRALRGATTCDVDTLEEIDAKTQALVTAMLDRNDVDHEDLVSIVFTATDDLHAQFPATAARALGLGDVPLLCARELDIVGGASRTIRIMMHLYTERTRAELHHVYLEGATSLRDDLPGVTVTVALLGTGLIGGSIGLALTKAGVAVVGYDADPDVAARAVTLGAVERVADSVADAVAGADVVIVAVPVGRVAALVVDALDAGAPAVTDVGSVKLAVLDDVRAARPDAAPRFVGGHPMAGSEQDGLDGADADLFAGATWVLTPIPDTDLTAHTAVRGVVGRLGAEVVEIPPGQHDALVAVVSHVPQLAATTLMNVAAAGADEHQLLLRLAAGGFRDMTRIAAGHPGIWPDICVANRDAILAALDAYRASLDEIRGLVAQTDGDALLATLERGRAARRNLPVGRPDQGPLTELRIPVPDRSGVIAEVASIAEGLGVNIVDIEVVHSIEGESGVLVLVVPVAGADAFDAGLVAAGYHVSRSDLA